MKVSLYVHVPFCKKKCDYCDFFSIGHADRAGKCNDLSDSYIEALLKEAALYARLYDISEWNTIYIGGGTPSLLSCDQLSRLMAGLSKIALFDKKSEVTIEVNPDDITPSFLASCRLCGINRISMGLQALDDRALKAVHRGADTGIILRALDFLEDNWHGRLSVDFIAGLPDHTYKSFEKQFEILEKYQNIDHVSLYTLTVEENTPLYKNIEEGRVKFSPDKADRMWIKGRNILEKLGFYQYEVSNFSRKGFESRHNSVYWAQESYIGLGAGASGTVYDFSSGAKALRWTNSLSIPAWQRGAEKKNLKRTTEELDEDTLEFEFLMLGFRTLRGVSDSEYDRRFHKSLSERLGAGCDGGLFSEWKKKGLSKIRKEGKEVFYSLTRRGILLLNLFLEELL